MYWVVEAEEVADPLKLEDGVLTIPDADEDEEPEVTL